MNDGVTRPLGDGGTRVLFGQLLREHRLRAGWTQEVLARRCGVSTHAISMLEAGRRRPRLSTVSRFAAALGLDEVGRSHLIAAAHNAGEEARPVVPQQLPASIRYFTGRLAELDAVADLATPRGDTVTIVAIDGMAGVGKTALAIHAAHRLAEQFPDGQLFIDLHGHTEGYEPRTAGDALAALLRALDVTAQQIPAEVEERAALYRQRLAATRTLVVLDNAASVAQVRPLIPASAGCLVLVTSRRRLKGLDDAYPVPLDVLPPADARALLSTVAGSPGEPADDPNLADIAEQCGRLPLALRMAAALLRHRPAWTARHLAELLRDQNHRIAALTDGDRDLGTVFGLSYHQLSDPQRETFRRLGLVPGPDFDAAAIAALTGTAPATAGRMLEELVDHNLLQQPSAGRYGLHDLLRVHARSLADDDPTEERRAALDRLLQYYQYLANRADAVITPYPRPDPDGPAPTYSPPLPDHGSAWAWLRTERPNLLAALQYVTPDPRTVALSHGLATLLLTDGPWADAIALHATAASVAQRHGDRSGRAYALLHQADFRLLAADYPPALRDVHEAVDLFRELDDRRGRATALTYLGLIATMTGDHPAATADLDEALRMYGEIGDRLGQANALIRLARVRITTGDHDGALRDLSEGVRLCQDLDDRRGQAYARCNLAEIKLARHDYPAAAEDLHEALRLFRDLGDDNGTGIAHGYLGQVATLTGDYPGAIQHLEEALHGYRRAGARGNEAWALNHYAAATAAAGDHDRALGLYRTAFLLAQEVQQPDDEAHALEGMAGEYRRAGDTEAATAQLKQALDLFQRLGMRTDADRVEARLQEV